MRLGTRLDGSRDGALIVVDRSGTRYVEAGDIAPSLQAALDEWPQARPLLAERADELASGAVWGDAVDGIQVGPPLPRAYEWIDASAYIQHVILVRRARGADLPENLRTDPLVYQGGSGVLLAATDAIALPDSEWGLDLEAEICVVLTDTPRGTRRSRASEHIALLMLANDVTYRNLVPAELKKGFGFLVSKPATAFAPWAITPDELGPAWHDGRAHLRVRSELNGALLGEPESGPEMHFSFFELIEHIATTRSFTAGTILGSGTVSNQDAARGVSCLAERRVREILETGEASTPFLKEGDVVRIEAFDDSGGSPFGAIRQEVVGA